MDLLILLGMLIFISVKRVISAVWSSTTHLVLSVAVLLVPLLPRRLLKHHRRKRLRPSRHKDY
jgi:Flp pilus assembly protein TadB